MEPPTGNGGARLQVDIVDHKVKAIKINGSDSNAFSICRGANIQVGDPVGKVYGACGSPSIVNNTYINQIRIHNLKNLKFGSINQDNINLRILDFC